MKMLTSLLLVAMVLTACQQMQTPRNMIQVEVPDFANSSGRKISMVTITGPEAREWDVFDRADAVMKYNEMPREHKEILFETVARTYAKLPAGCKLSSTDINTGIWREVTARGVDLSFGDDPSDWHPYLMYIHPIIIGEMTNFFILARDGSISDAELNEWQIAGCNVINAGPDSITAAAMLARKDELEKAGIIITLEDGRLSARRTRVNWQQYRAGHH